MKKLRNMFAMHRSVKALFLLVALAALNGCGTTPVPLPVFLGDVRDEHIKSVAQAPPSHLATVMKCIAENLEENAGLKIAGVIAEEGESPYVFAAPEKSGGLVMVQIKDLNLADPSAEFRLTLVLRVFDSSGKNCYTRSITNTLRINSQQDKLDEALQLITKDILRQYAKDPALRPLILKYKLSSLLKFG